MEKHAYDHVTMQHFALKFRLREVEVGIVEVVGEARKRQ